MDSPKASNRKYARTRRDSCLLESNSLAESLMWESMLLEAVLWYFGSMRKNEAAKAATNGNME